MMAESIRSPNVCDGAYPAPESDSSEHRVTVVVVRKVPQACKQHRAPLLRGAEKKERRTAQAPDLEFPAKKKVRGIT